MRDNHIDIARANLRVAADLRFSYRDAEERAKLAQEEALACIEASVRRRLQDIIPEQPPNRGDSLDTEVRQLCWLILWRMMDHEKAATMSQSPAGPRARGSEGEEG